VTVEVAVAGGVAEGGMLVVVAGSVVGMAVLSCAAWVSWTTIVWAA
jgi:hypothetical protein